MSGKPHVVILGPGRDHAGKDWPLGLRLAMLKDLQGTPGPWNYSQEHLFYPSDLAEDFGAWEFSWSPPKMEMTVDLAGFRTTLHGRFGAPPSGGEIYASEAGSLVGPQVQNFEQEQWANAIRALLNREGLPAPEGGIRFNLQQSYVTC